MNKHMPARHIFLKVAGLMLAIPLFIMLAGYLWLQTENAQKTLRALLEKELADGLGYEVAIDGFEVGFPLNAAADRLLLSDRQGPWLEATQVHIGLVPSLAIAESIHLYSMQAKSINLLRVPQEPEADDSESIGPDIDIDGVSVSSVILSPEVTGLEEPVRMGVQGNIAWDGEQKQLVFNVDGTLGKMPLAQLQGARYAIEGSYVQKNDTITLTSVDMQGQKNTSINGNLVINRTDQTLAGGGTITIPELSAMSPAIKGSATGEFSLSGTLAAPVVKAALTSPQLTLQGIVLANAEWHVTAQQDSKEGWTGTSGLTAQQEGQDIRLANEYQLTDTLLRLGKIEGQYASCDIAGDATLTLESALVRGDLKGHCDNLTDISFMVPAVNGGSASYQASLAHAAGRQALKADIQLDGLKTGYGNIGKGQIALSVPDIARQVPEQLSIQAQQAEIQGVEAERLTVTLTPADKIWHIQGAVQGNIPVPYHLNLSGQLELASLNEATVTLAALQGSINDISIHLTKPAEVRYTSQAIGWSVPGLALAQGSLTSQGQWTGSTITASADIDAMPLAFSPKAMPDPIRQASLSGTLKVTGGPASPEIVLNSRLANVQLAEKTAAVTVPVDVTYKDNKAQIVSQFSQQGVISTDIDITMPLAFSLSPFIAEIEPHGPLSGSVALDISAGGISRLWLAPAHVVNGAVSGTLKVGGTWGKPDLTGTLAMKNGTYQYVPYGVALSDIHASFTAQGSRIEMQNLSATGKKGNKLTANGWLELNEAMAYAVTVKADEVALLNHPNAQGLISGDIRFSGTQEQGLLEGTVIPRPLEIRLPQQVSSSVPQLNIVATVSEEEEEQGIDMDYPVTLQLTIKAEEQVFVRGRGIDAEIGGKILVTGNIDNPVFNGQLATKRGRYEEFGKKFIITEGVLTFEGNIPPSPYLRIVASTSAGDIEVKPMITGPLMEPRLSVASNPSLPEDEALSRLMFGKDARSLSPVQAVQLANSIRKLSGRAGGDFDPLSRVRETLGVDELRMGTGGDNEEDPTVGVGKYLNERIYLDVERGAQTGTGRVSVEIDVTPSISVESSTGESGQSSVGVNWKYDY